MKYVFIFLVCITAGIAGRLFGGQAENLLTVERTEEGIQVALRDLAKENMVLVEEEKRIMLRLQDMAVAATNRTGAVENPELTAKLKRIEELDRVVRQLRIEVRELQMNDPAVKARREAAQEDQAALREIFEKKRELAERRQLLLKEKIAIQQKRHEEDKPKE